MLTRVAVAVVLVVGTSASAAEIGVVGTKLIIVDKLLAAGKAKVVYVSKDPTAGITKGSATNRSTIEATFDFGYDATAGRIHMQFGAFGEFIPGEGWTHNEGTYARFVNPSAPAGSTVAKVGLIVNNKQLKVVARGLGDPPDVIDILTAPPSTGDVFTAYTVRNLGSTVEVTAHCSAFSACKYKVIAAGTGAKLVCKTSTADPDCTAL